MPENAAGFQSPDFRTAGEAEEFIRALPKAELHLHLEGSIEPGTLAALARSHGVPELSPEIYNYTDFLGFLQSFKQVCSLLRAPQDYHLITLRMIERLRRDGASYAEVYIAAGVMLWKGEAFEQFFQGICLGAQQGRAKYGVELRFILDATRQFGAEAAMRVAELAVAHKNQGVIGIGIGGDEKQAPPEMFAAVYEYARTNGLRLTAHAGEVAGPESMWGALRALHAERLGHGVTAERDPDLVKHLARTRVPVDMCPTSNFRTGAIARLEDHPLRRYFDAGMLVSLSTDDPAMFQTDLTREYMLAHTLFGFTAPELARLAYNSFQGSFLSAEDKARYTR
jgi:adenosine deaminase/aminodeoxyfutalosine deaminase